MAPLSKPLTALLLLASAATGAAQPQCTTKLSPATILARLRAEPFNLATEAALASHPFVRDAEAGNLTLAAQRAFLGEQFAIQRSDAAAFAVLAGHADWRPGASLADATLPPARDPDANDIFQFLLGGELYAASLLIAAAEALGMGDTKTTVAERLAAWPITSGAQGYPSFWARLALNGERAAAAAACAVNFPAWGRMCARVRDGLTKTAPAGADNARRLGFLAFFGSPIDGLDAMATAVLDAEGQGVCYEELATSVRLLQEYELAFWDAVYAAAGPEPRGATPTGPEADL